MNILNKICFCSSMYQYSINIVLFINVQKMGKNFREHTRMPPLPPSSLAFLLYPLIVCGHIDTHIGAYLYAYLPIPPHPKIGDGQTKWQCCWWYFDTLMMQWQIDMSVVIGCLTSYWQKNTFFEVSVKACNLFIFYSCISFCLKDHCDSWCISWKWSN